MDRPNLVFECHEHCVYLDGNPRLIEYEDDPDGCFQIDVAHMSCSHGRRTCAASWSVWYQSRLPMQ